tara:strand:- start:1468 stop:1674 length:207 start_codon:yes stop_codon:yes gene_type:complete
MAEQKISELPIAAALDGTESVVINQNAVTSITDVDAIVTYALTNGISGTFGTPTSITIVNGIITAIVD